ncbi:MAG: hypothetical protein MSG64_01400 [Pyrinomonadaceae bacterium MAG19_C2-C3]|nr:hypothetical protein [Pyrinomonadaceae bacterium MAG19_C2-C3]
MSSQLKTKLTAQEYLEIERAAEVGSEFYNEEMLRTGVGCWKTCAGLSEACGWSRLIARSHCTKYMSG